MKKEWSRRELYAHGEPFGDCATQRKLGGGYICGGGGKGSAPQAPDYTAAAEKQGESSKEVTNMQTWANRPNQSTPWGNINWTPSATVDPATGQPVTQWQQSYNLNPESQRALDAQMKLQTDRSELAGSFIDRVRNDLSTPFNWGGMPKAGDPLQRTEFERVGTAPRLQTELDTSANPAERQRIENALFERMRPIHDQQQTALDAKLANMGITAGSEAYNRATQRLGDQQSRERFNALEMGGNEMQRLFGMQLQEGQFENTAKQNQQGLDLNTTGFNNQVSTNRFNQDVAISEYQNKLRQQAIAEENMKRLSSLNEMNALLTGQQVNYSPMPQFNGAAASQAVQYLPAATSQYQSSLDAFNAQNQNANSFTSGLFGLGGSLGSAAMFAFSDSRLKKIIKRVGEAQGIPLYLFKYLGSNTEHIGPIAQEVQKIRPDLVKRHQNGYLMVNYKLLMEA